MIPPYTCRLMARLGDDEPIEIYRVPAKRKLDIKTIQNIKNEMSPEWTITLERPTPRTHIIGRTC